jgi:hypothetical protein
MLSERTCDSRPEAAPEQRGGESKERFSSEAYSQGGGRLDKKHGHFHTGKEVAALIRRATLMSPMGQHFRGTLEDGRNIGRLAEVVIADGTGSLTTDERLNQTTQDWHTSGVTLSVTKGLSEGFFAPLRMTQPSEHNIKCTNVMWFDLEMEIHYLFGGTQIWEHGSQQGWQFYEGRRSPYKGWHNNDKSESCVVVVSLVRSSPDTNYWKTNTLAMNRHESQIRLDSKI